MREVLVTIDTCPKPTIAVVHGAAVGGGATFAACCDVALAGDRAFFSIPEVRVGMPPLGVMPFLVRAMGHRNFRRYGLSGERISAAEAMRIGLVHQVCEMVELEDTLARITDELLHGAPGAIATLKAAAAEFAAPTLSAILANKATHDSEIGRSARRRRQLPRKAQADLVSEVKSHQECDRRCRGHDCSPPPCGEGYPGPGVLLGAAASRKHPTPNPSPQGGGERAVPLASS